MKNKFRWIVLGAFVFSAQQGWAESICATNLAEYTQIKSKIPASFQNLPAVFTIEQEGSAFPIRLPIRAGFVLKAVGQKLVLEMKVAQPIKSRDEQPVTEACLVGNTISVKLENGKVYKVGVLSGNRIDIDGRQLSKTNIATLNQLMNKPAPSPSGSSASGGT